MAEVKLDGKTTKVPFAKGEVAKAIDIAIASPRLWDLDNPNLYDVTLTLGDDTVKTYFGFREVGIGTNANGDAYVTLNGKPIYLQMCLDQSYHPEGYYTFPTDEYMKNEIMISKKLALSGPVDALQRDVGTPLHALWQKGREVRACDTAPRRRGIQKGEGVRSDAHHRRQLRMPA